VKLDVCWTSGDQVLVSGITLQLPARSINSKTRSLPLDTSDVDALAARLRARGGCVQPHAPGGLAEVSNRGYSVIMLSPVINLAEAVNRLSNCESEIRALGVSRLALFGSVLRGQPHPDSDVDVLVQFAAGTKTYERFLSLAELLERQLGRRVELVTAEALSPFIGPRILAEAEDVLGAA